MNEKLFIMIISIINIFLLRNYNIKYEIYYAQLSNFYLQSNAYLNYYNSIYISIHFEWIFFKKDKRQIDDFQFEGTYLSVFII